jgi:hypothetical protein
MTQAIELKHEFVEFIPEELKQGTVYVSIRFATASHLCVCGCKTKVVTPLTPTDWKLIFDGKTISLDPSIGNWSFACESHYWIRNNRVKWAPAWSKIEIERGRHQDQHAKQSYFETTRSESDVTPKSDPAQSEKVKNRRSLLQKFKWW